MIHVAPQGFTVRPATPEDRPALLDLYRELQAFECKLHPNRDDPDVVTEPHWQYLEDLVEKRDGRIWLAETADGQAIGFVLVLFEDCEPYLIERDRRSGYVSDLMVSKAARGSGVGGALMDTAETFFRERGVAQLRVGVLCANSTARGFYDEIGFQPYEMFYEKRLDDLEIPEVKQ